MQVPITHSPIIVTHSPTTRQYRTTPHLRDLETNCHNLLDSRYYKRANDFTAARTCQQRASFRFRRHFCLVLPRNLDWRATHLGEYLEEKERSDISQYREKNRLESIKMGDLQSVRSHLYVAPLQETMMMALSNQPRINPVGQACSTPRWTSCLRAWRTIALPAFS